MSNSFIGQSQSGAVPNITVSLAIASMINKTQTTSLNNISAGGCFKSSIGSKLKIGDGDATTASWFSEGTGEFRASDSNSLYNNDLTWFAGTKVIPAGTGMNYIIKY